MGYPTIEQSMQHQCEVEQYYLQSDTLLSESKADISETREIEADIEANQSQILIVPQNNESLIDSIAEEKNILEQSDKQEIRRIEPIELPGIIVDKSVVEKLRKILFRSRSKKKSPLAMLYRGFYSLRYNAQKHFGSKFGERRNTPEKRLKDDVSEISDNLTNLEKQSKLRAANATLNEDLSEVGDSNILTPHMRDDVSNTIFNNFSEMKQQTNISNISNVTNKYDDHDKTNVSDFKADPQERNTSLIKKLEFEETKIRDSEEEVNIRHNKLRTSDRYFGKIQLLGKKKRQVKQSKHGHGLLLLQPGPRFPVGLYNPKQGKYFKNPFDRS